METYTVKTPKGIYGVMCDDPSEAVPMVVRAYNVRTYECAVTREPLPVGVPILGRSIRAYVGAEQATEPTLDECLMPKGAARYL